MYEILVPLEMIEPNPWQPREKEDAEHIKNLALSIARDSLLQKPAGRLIDSDGKAVRVAEALGFVNASEPQIADERQAWAYLFESGARVQLAFGHSRLAAFAWLRDVGPNSDLQGDWSAMPVIVRDTGDEEMFRLAVSENLQRRDLSPIEEARAMRRYRDEFGKTSAEIGTLFGLNESSVRNKIRLLGLPEDVQTAIQTEGISERVAREVLSLFSLPEEVRKKAEETIPAWTSEYRPSAIIRSALNGSTSEQVAQQVKGMLERISVSMQGSLFKHERAFEGEGFQSPACKGCPLRIVAGNGVFCQDKDCYSRKQAVVKGEYLERASQACGIQVIEDASIPDYQMTSFYSDDKIKALIAAGCQNLRLVYAEYGKESIVEDYPYAKVVCMKHPAHCVCRRALEHGVELQPVGTAAPAGEEPDRESADEPEKPAGLTADDLRQIDRELRAAKKRNLAQVRALRDQAQEKVFAGMRELNPVVWHGLVGLLVSYQKRDALEGAPVEELFKALAERLVVDLYDFERMYGEPKPENAAGAYNRLLKQAGLPLVSVSAETEES